MALIITPHDHEDGTIRAALRKAAGTHLKAPGDRMDIEAVLSHDGERMTTRLVQPHLRGAIGGDMEYTVRSKDGALTVWRLS